MNFERKQDPMLLCPGSVALCDCVALWESLRSPLEIVLDIDLVCRFDGVREYELLDTGILDNNKYFDVVVECGALLMPCQQPGHAAGHAAARDSQGTRKPT